MTAAPSAPVVVTGLGCLSAYGIGAAQLWSGLLASRPGIGPLRRFDCRGYPARIAGEFPEDVEGLRRAVEAGPEASLADLFALQAAQEALSQAGLDLGRLRMSVGVYFGGSTGGLAESESYYERVRRAPASWRSIRELASQPVSSPAESLARHVGATGPVMTVSSACASGTMALGLALDALRSGEIDIALAGGSDSLARTTFGGFNALQSVDPLPCRPFRADRAGLTLGEGGAVLVLERQDSVLSRGGRVLARLMGAGTAADAHHMTAPDPEGTGAARAVRHCLDDAACTPDDVDFVNAHGTGTPLNDRAEFKALQLIFGDRAGRIPVVASKAGTGHLLGSAGAIEAAITVLCLHHQRLHPVPAAGPLDPEAAVDLVQEPGGRQAALRTGLSLSLGFGGSNAAALFAVPGHS